MGTGLLLSSSGPGTEKEVPSEPEYPFLGGGVGGKGMWSLRLSRGEDDKILDETLLTLSECDSVCTTIIEFLQKVDSGSDIWFSF